MKEVDGIEFFDDFISGEGSEFKVRGFRVDGENVNISPIEIDENIKNVLINLYKRLSDEDIFLARKILSKFKIEESDFLEEVFDVSYFWKLHGCEFMVNYKANSTLERLRKLFKLDKLIVGNKNIPKSIVHYPIKSLDLKNNDFPNYIFELDIEYINFCYVQNVNICNKYNNFKNLRTLIIDFAKNITVDPSVKFDKLEKICILSSRLEEVPNFIRQFKSINRLSLNNNNLTDLPNWLNVLSNIDTLDLEFNNFEKIPNVLYEMDNLVTCKMKHNKLKFKLEI